MLLSRPIAGDAILHRIDTHRPIDARSTRERVPRRHRHGHFPAAVPDQLAQIGDHDGCFGALGTRLGGFDEVDDRAGIEVFLAESAVGEDAEVLNVAAEEEDDAGCGAEIAGHKNRDVRLIWSGGLRESDGSQAQICVAEGEFPADADVEGFAVGFEDAFVFADVEVEFEVGRVDRADFVVLVDAVPGV